MMVKHINFHDEDIVFETSIKSSYHIISTLLPKILLMELELDVLKWYYKSSFCSLTLKIYKTRRRVLFKGDDNDTERVVKY